MMTGEATDTDDGVSDCAVPAPGPAPAAPVALPSSPSRSKPRQSPIHGLMKSIIGECLIACNAFPVSTTESESTNYDEGSSGIFHPNNLRLKNDLRLQGKKLGQRLFGCAANSGDPSSQSSWSSMQLSSFPQQFVQLQGLGIISLGALEDELSPRERVWETFKQSTTSSSRTDRLISIGYLVQEEPANGYDRVEGNGDHDNDDDDDVVDKHSNSHLKARECSASGGDTAVGTQSIPYDVWVAAYPNDVRSMSRPIRRLINQIQGGKFNEALVDLRKACAEQMTNPSTRNGNAYLHGITLHNMGVVTVMAMKKTSAAGSNGDVGGSKSNNDNNNDDKTSYEAALSLFEQAVAVKKQMFGPEHIEVALSLDEMGIQLFALERYEEALTAFSQSLAIWTKGHRSLQQRQKVKPNMNEALGTASAQFHPAIVRNNIACCQFQMRILETSVSSMMLALDLLQHNCNEHQNPSRDKKNNIDGAAADDDIDADADDIMLHDQEKKSGDSDDCKFSVALTGTREGDPTYNDGVVGAVSEARSDLDLLKISIVLNNSGYLLFNQKKYDDARSYFQEALLVQESVLGDSYNHRVIRSNIDFTNAFHAE